MSEMTLLLVFIIMAGLVAFGVTEVLGQSLVERHDYDKHRED